MPPRSPRARLTSAAKTIARLREEGLGCRAVAERYNVAIVTLLDWHKAHFGASWGAGRPTGRRARVDKETILEAGRIHHRLKDAAAAVGLSEPGFAHALSRITGKSWRAWRKQFEPPLAKVRKAVRKELREHKGEAHVRAAIALRLREDGLNLATIGKILGVTESGACRLIQRSRDAGIQPADGLTGC